MKELDNDRLTAKEMVAKLDRKQKMHHYLEYYRVPLMIAVILLIIGVFFLVQQLNRLDALMFFGVVNSDQINEEKLVEGMREQLDLGDRETVIVKAGLQNTAKEGDPEFYRGLEMALTQTEMDAIFTDEKGLLYLLESDSLYPLEDWLSDELIEQWSDGFYSAETEFWDKKEDEKVKREVPVAVDLSGTKVMEYLELPESVHYLVVPKATEKASEVAAFCDFLYYIETGIDLKAQREAAVQK